MSKLCRTRLLRDGEVIYSTDDVFNHEKAYREFNRMKSNPSWSGRLVLEEAEHIPLHVTHRPVVHYSDDMWEVVMEEERAQIKLNEELVDRVREAMGYGEWQTARAVWLKADELDDKTRRPLRLTRVRKALKQMAEEGNHGIMQSANPDKKSGDGREPYVYMKQA